MRSKLMTCNYLMRCFCGLSPMDTSSIKNWSSPSCSTTYEPTIWLKHFIRICSLMTKIFLAILYMMCFLIITASQSFVIYSGIATVLNGRKVFTRNLTTYFSKYYKIPATSKGLQLYSKTATPRFYILCTQKRFEATSFLLKIKEFKSS